MTVAPGLRLGPYEIAAKLGEGGMGEVWRARDVKLEREVAIKVLPAALGADAEALARFEREAKAVAALSHPNILSIFDFGASEGVAYAAMELLEGETLRRRLEAGALPARKALEFAAQVALGLAAAHARGIVHRDLKPDNLFLTRDGRVKILDFGLARQTGFADSQSQLLAAETRAPETAPGAVLGTVGYMSPEQVRGETADWRSDLFSLGVVLYEMLAGRRAFARDSAVETMSAILRDEPPDLEGLAERVSPAVVRLLQRCLEKRAEERFQSARDLAFDLQSLAAGETISQRSALRPPPAARSSWRAALRVGLLVAGGAAAGWAAALWLAGGRGEPAPRVDLSFRQLTKTPGGEGSPALSPDGESFVFVKRDGADLDLFLQRVDGAKAVPLTAECALNDHDPAISADGRSIAFRSECDGGGVFVMGATGESRRRVTGFGFQPAWSPDGRELAVVTEPLDTPTSRNSLSELWAVKVDSGERRRVTARDAMGPTWSPDGRRIAFWGLRSPGVQRDLWSVASDGSQSGVEQAVSLVDDAAVDWAPEYSADGRWLYFASTRGGTFNLWRLAVDRASGAPIDRPEALTAPSASAGPFALSADGRRLVYAARHVETEIVGAPFDPGRREFAAPPVHLFSGSFELREQSMSPDGEWLLFVNEDPPQQLHLVRRDGSGYRQLTTEGNRNRQGRWSPQGDWIVFQTTRGDASLAVIRPDGSGWQPLPVGLGMATPVWSSDGATIGAFDNERGGLLFDLRAGFGAVRESELPPIAPGLLFWPTAWSPDGAWLAGRAIRSGQIVNIVLRASADGSYHQLGPSSEGREVADFSVAFVGNSNVVHSDERGLWIRDLRGGEPKLLVRAAAGERVTNPSASRDGSQLSWIVRSDESDLWLMTLAEASGEDGARPR